MKNILILLVGLAIGYFSSQWQEQKPQLYGSRDLATELKGTVDRVNLALDDSEKKNIKNNVPKPTPPKPEITCKCNGAGHIVQPDGNKSQCQCSANGGTCKCKPSTEPPLVSPQ